MRHFALTGCFNEQIDRNSFCAFIPRAGKARDIFQQYDSRGGAKGIDLVQPTHFYKDRPDMQDIAERKLPKYL